MARTNYEAEVKKLDPGAKLCGPKWYGHYRCYWVEDSAGVEIGYTDGNEGNEEGGEWWAWLSAYGTLQRRARHAARQAVLESAAAQATDNLTQLNEVLKIGHDR